MLMAKRALKKIVSTASSANFMSSCEAGSRATQ
jgi:hypothetical protein